MKFQIHCRREDATSAWACRLICRKEAENSWISWDRRCRSGVAHWIKYRSVKSGVSSIVVHRYDIRLLIRVINNGQFDVVRYAMTGLSWSANLSAIPPLDDGDVGSVLFVDEGGDSSRWICDMNVDSVEPDLLPTPRRRRRCGRRG